MRNQQFYINQLAICTFCETESLQINPHAIIPSAAHTVRVVLSCQRQDSHVHWCDYCGVILNPKLDNERVIVV